MGQRNLLCTNQMINFQMDQTGQGLLHPDPCRLLGSVASFPQPHFHPMLPPPSGSTSNFEIHHLQENYEGTFFYGMAPYDGVQHHSTTNLELGVPGYYNTYMPPSSTATMFPVSENHIGESSCFVDGVRGSCKRKITEGFPANLLCASASSSSSSSVTPMNSSGVLGVSAEPSTLVRYRCHESPSIMEGGYQRSVRNRSADSVLAHNHNHLMQGNYIGSPYQVAGPPWLDQQVGRSGGDGGSAWNQASAVPYMHGPSIGPAPLNMGLQGHHETAAQRSFLHPPPIHPPQTFHQTQPPLLQGVGGQNANPHHLLATSSHRYPSSSTSQGMSNSPHGGGEIGFRHLGHLQATGFRLYGSRLVVGGPGATLRRRHFPRLIFDPSEEVAMLEFPDSYEEDDFTDHHRDMRMDIEHMSYEQLLALGERIGKVNTGLKEETIRSHLKATTYLSSGTRINLEEEACMDEGCDSCIICQSNFENGEEISRLDCGHEYHTDCLKKWLLVKNVCPICKCPALNP